MRNDRVSMVNFGLIVILFDRPVTRIAGSRYLISDEERVDLRRRGSNLFRGAIS